MKHLSTSMTFIAALTLSGALFAQSTVKDKMKTLETNVENSKANKEDYLKNLKIVEENISEVSKAKNNLLSNKKEIDKSKNEIKSAMGQIQKAENELKKQGDAERALITAEQAKIKQLEETLQKLKNNLVQREEKLVDIKNKTESLQTEKSNWAAKEKEVRDLETANATQLKSVTSTESQMIGKKKGYEAEISRWNKEIEKHEKNLSTFRQLAN